MRPMPDPVRSLLLKEQVAIITGGGSGVGKACASSFGREGAAPAIFDLDSDSGPCSRGHGDVSVARAQDFRRPLMSRSPNVEGRGCCRA